MSTSALTLGRASFPVVLPDIRDARLHVAAVIITIHLLGQLGLNFVVSIPQVLVSILTCAVLEIAITFQQKRALVWPASAMLTGSGIGLILRVVGTPPGDHWSTFGLHLYAAVAALALLSKYLIRYRGAPLFNPSNVGLVATFIVLGEARVEPLDFWWAPPNAWMILAYVVILTGGVLITRRLRLVSLAVTFWATLAAGIGLLAASGHCITANWAFAPVCGFDFWRVVVTSPEILIFLFFMITDPRTVPSGGVGRITFGALVAAVGTLMLAPQTTEFGAKVGLLAGLTVLCAARPLFDRIVPEAHSAKDTLCHDLESLVGISRGDSHPLRLAITGLALVSMAIAVMLAGTPARDATRSDAALTTLESARMDPGTFPVMSVDAAVTDWDPTLTDSVVQDILLTSAQNLEIENDALLRSDAELLMSVDHGDRLVEMRDRISTAMTTGSTRIEHYQPDLVDVHLLRPFGRQDGLSLGLKARGTMTTEMYAADGHLLTRSSAPFALTFVVRRATGARWLNVAVLPGDADPAGML
jgi:hypothetical protein